MVEKQNRAGFSSVEIMDVSEPENIGVISIVSSAWRSCYATFQSMPFVYAASFVLFAISSWLEFRAENLTGASRILADAGISLLQALISAPLAVAVHRAILLGRITSSLSLRPVYVWRFVLWLGMLTLSTQITSGLADFPGASIWTKLALIILAIYVGYCSVRLTLVFPAIAVEWHGTVWKESWFRTRGRFWFIFGSECLVLSPLIIVALVGGTIFGGGSKATYFGYEWASIFIDGAFGTIAVSLLAAVASWIFLNLGRDAPNSAR